MKKMFFLSLIFAVTVLCSFNAKASDYTSDEMLIDQMFNNATEGVIMPLNSLNMGSNAGGTFAAEKDAIVAIALDFFLGGFGIHRFYLGTEVLTGVGYILTCGGIFGIVPLVDFVVLIIDNADISPYINNPNFFMWM
jgi:TM2 domain-containing membrane protein YozV